MLSTSPVYDVRARDERPNGQLTWHYRVDMAATSKAISQLQSEGAGDSSPHLECGDTYLAEEGGYVARLIANNTGEIGIRDFSGQFTLRYDLTASDKPDNGIQFPTICNDAISGNAVTQGPVGDAN